MNNFDDLNKLIKSVLTSNKYKNISIDAIRNVGKQELLKRKNLKQAIKYTKNKLHQTAGSFFDRKVDYDKWFEMLKKAKEQKDFDLFRSYCLEIMSLHSSTKERIPILQNFYNEIFSFLPEINSVLDLGCGLNLLAIYHSQLKKNFSYYGFDIYEDMILFLNKFRNLLGISGYTEVLDLIQFPVEIKADLAFVLKLLPTLEQIDKSISINLLESLDVKYIVTSFPVRSLCGKNKNMQENYSLRFKEIIRQKNWKFKCLEFQTELVFIVFK